MRFLTSSILAIGTLLFTFHANAQEPDKQPEGETPLQAGSHGGTFYLRDAEDNFRLHFQARAQIDAFNYFGPGVSDTGLKSTMFLRRVRPELTGEFFQGKFQ